jgi:hypothetical protein
MLRVSVGVVPTVTGRTFAIVDCWTVVFAGVVAGVLAGTLAPLGEEAGVTDAVGLLPLPPPPQPASAVHRISAPRNLFGMTDLH